MKNNVRYRLKKVQKQEAVQADLTIGRAAQKEKTILIMSPEDFTAGSSKIAVAVEKDENFQRGDVFEVTFSRVEKSKRAKPAAAEEKPEGERTDDGGEEGGEQELSKGVVPMEDAVNRIWELDTPEAVKAYIKGDDRTGVNEAAKDRIKQLKESK